MSPMVSGKTASGQQQIATIHRFELRRNFRVACKTLMGSRLCSLVLGAVNFTDSLIEIADYEP